ncbi:MAG: helix-turn-helix transcriptional regulator [Lachnospiraceae bacterium]|nr:helix-turn-helix transcriptional regulator [Lachnospiraceae bacterium]
MASLSPYYFSRLFKAETSFTPHQYVIETRISAAKYLLTSTSEPISQIAYKTGFPDESSFCACFRKKENVTPPCLSKTGLVRPLITFAIRKAYNPL